MKISVLMSCYNRGYLLNITMPSLIRQHLINEIIIVDDGSTDNTVKIVKYWQNICSTIKLKYFYRDKSGYNNSAIPKNIALKKSTGDLIIVSDPEMIHLSLVIKQMLKYHEESDKIYTVASSVYFIPKIYQPKLAVAVYQTNILQGLLSGADEYHIGYEGKNTIYVQRNIESPYIGGFKRSHLFAIGGWDERFDQYWGLEDIDLIARLGRYGINRIQDNSIQGIHQWHERPPLSATEGVDTYNLKILQKRSDTEYIANSGKDWGIL